MNRPSIPPQNQPPRGRPLPDGLPGELAAMLPPGNVVILRGPRSGTTTLLEATMLRLLAQPGGSARFLTSSRQAALASTERLLGALNGASGGELGCGTLESFAPGRVHRPARHV